MLEANKSVWFEKIFAVYNRNLLNRRFHDFQVSGLNYLLIRNINIPLIIYCNHSSWWDGLVAFQISSHCALHSFIMMEEKHLRKLFLFRKLGAFSVVREKPREAVKSINYAAGILKDFPFSTLWVFPQGEILPNDRRPLKFFNGISKIIERIGCCETASLSIRYDFLGEFKPRIFVKIEKPEEISVGSEFNCANLTENFRLRLTDSLDELKIDVINHNFTGFESII